MNVGSPEPVMTRHLWPAAILTGLFVAAGVDELSAAATAAKAPATATAIQIDQGILRRIDRPFSPSVGRGDTISENVSGSVNRFIIEKSSCFSQIAGDFGSIRSGTFRNVLE